MRITSVPCTLDVCLDAQPGVKIDFTNGCWDETIAASVDARQLTDQLQYEERLDAYLHTSDDGETIYVAVHVPEQEEPGDAPPVHELAQYLIQGMAPLVTAVANSEMMGSDLTFAINIFKTPALICRAWKENGRDIAAAQKAVARDVFGIGT